MAKILVVGQHFWPENFRINDIVDFLLEDGHQVDILCGRPNYPKGRLFEGYSLWNHRKENYKTATIYRSFEIPRGNNTNLRIFLNYVSFPISSIFHIPRLSFKRYDAIFIYQLSPVMMSIAGLLLGKLTHTRTTMYVLDLWPENLYSVLDIKNKHLRRLVRWVSHWHYKRPDNLIALSETMKDRLLKIRNRQQDDITVIPQAAEKLYEKPISDPALEARLGDKFNLVFTGNISPAQSFETILNAMENLKSKGISDIRIVIVGDGMSRAHIEEEVRYRNLSDMFTFEGYKPIDQMPRYMELADALIGCLVKSDLLEATIPAKVMSYLASGKPIVLAMDGEVQDLINNTIKCGYAGGAGDAQMLASNIEKLRALSSKQRHVLGNRAKAYHLRYFERNLLLGKMRDSILGISKV